MQVEGLPRDVFAGKAEGASEPSFATADTRHFSAPLSSALEMRPGLPLVSAPLTEH